MKKSTPSDLVSTNSRKLRRAAARGDFDLASESIKILAAPNISGFIDNTSTNGNTALHWAVIGANPEDPHHNTQGVYQAVIDLLLEHGANDLLKNQEGKTVYDLTPHDKNPVLKSEALFLHETTTNTAHMFSSLGASAFSGGQKTVNDFFRNNSSHLLKILLGLEMRRFLPQGDTKLRILSLGCGSAQEVLTLNKYFGYINTEFEYVGIDIDATRIRNASVFYKDFPNVSFYCADASSPQALSSIVTPGFDLGILRNADFTETQGYRDAYRTMVNLIFPWLLKSDAPLLSTYYDDEQLSLALEHSNLRSYTNLSKNYITCSSGVSYSTASAPGIFFSPDKVSLVLRCPETLSIQAKAKVVHMLESEETLETPLIL